MIIPGVLKVQAMYRFYNFGFEYDKRVVKNNCWPLLWVLNIWLALQIFSNESKTGPLPRA